MEEKKEEQKAEQLREIYDQMDDAGKNQIISVVEDYIEQQKNTPEQKQ